MNQLVKSWSAFPETIARTYMKGFGSPDLSTKREVRRIIKEISGNSNIRLIEFGCGNAQMYEYLKEEVEITYTGVDFSEPLIEAARLNINNDKNVELVAGDICEFDKKDNTYDMVLFSHVIEMLSSPSQALAKAKELAPIILIRFFEAPTYEHDLVELLDMDVGKDQKVPYLRRKMGSDYYKLILQKLGCNKVDVYAVNPTCKDQVHVLYL